MKYFYEIGAVRWRRHTAGDVRGVRVPEGWEAMAEQVDHHPITGEKLKRLEWWIKETFVGDDD